MKKKILGISNQEKMGGGFNARSEKHLAETFGKQLFYVCS